MPGFDLLAQLLEEKTRALADVHAVADGCVDGDHLDVLGGALGQNAFHVSVEVILASPSCIQMDGIVGPFASHRRTLGSNEPTPFAAGSFIRGHHAV